MEYISVRNDSHINSVRQQFNTDQAAEGVQFAELNAEAAGTLYQDVLTTPGAALYWSLSHRGRNQPGGGAVANDKDTMYVIIAAAKDVDGIILNQTDVNELVSRYTADGDYSITYKSRTFHYYVSKQSHDNIQWYSVAGTYGIPTGQYLTRFFFAAGETAFDRRNPSSSNKNTVGNLIDDISFSEDIAYRIEYYVNGTHQPARDQAGAGAVNSIIVATNTPADMTLVSTTLNNAPYSGGTSIKLMPNRAHVLKLYYESNGISVTKVIAGLDGATSEDLETLLDGYQTRFELYEPGNPNSVAFALVNVNASTLSGTAVFMQTANPALRFLPTGATTYTIREVSPPAIPGYEYVSTTPSETTVTGLSASVTFTNTYQLPLPPQTFDLTITKTVTDGTPTQSFIFDITGANNFSMSVVLSPGDFANGTASITVYGLPSGTYTVTERGNWSWQYVLDGSAQAQTVTKEDGTEAEVTFNNKRNDVHWLGDTTIIRNIFAVKEEGDDA